MKRFLLPLTLIMAIAGCKEKSDDPMRAFKDLALVHSENTAPLSWIQKDDWIFNEGDSVCARLFIDPQNMGACEGNRPSLPSPEDEQFFTSSKGDTVVMWRADDNIAHVIDLSNAPDVSYMGSFQSNDQLSRFFFAGIHDGYLYGLIDGKTLGVFDLALLGGSIPLEQDTLEMGRITLDGLANIFHAAFQDTFAYVGGNGGHIYVISIADPTQPRVLSDVQVQLSNGLITYDEHLYNKGNHHLDIISLANPAKPIPVDRIDGIDAHALTFDGDYMYLGAGGEIRIYDVSSPSTPVLLRKIDTGTESVHEINLFGNYLVAQCLTGSYSQTYNRLYFYPNTP